MNVRPLVLMLLVAGCVFPACVIVDGDGGRESTRVTNPSDEFDSLAVSGRFDHVEVEVCDCQPTVKITGHERQVDNVTVLVDDGVLELDRDRQLIVTDIDLHVLVRAPKIATIVRSGSGDVRVTGVQTPTLEVVSEGSGNLDVSGQVEVLDIVKSGSGNVSAFDLVADTVEANGSGSGDIRVCARHRLRALLSGSGDLFYDCRPEDVDFDTTGSGRVSLR